ncbi:MAG: Gfo/Idh/MocA family oxidoreductase [Chloroflexi bacterium]|nr:Gfo/Idh/MocA family oxidoreductase [Chloroflexota bacterium]
MAATPLRWGVLGISEQVGRKAVLPALRDSPTAELLAIASRDAGRAQEETQRFGARRSYGAYADLLADPEIEAVYIPLPNSLHHEWTVAAAEAGKHVLCEKPLACTAAEAEAMASACTAAGVVLMEAYMTPFHPRSARIVELARSGALGALRFARTAFTFPLEDSANHRWRPEMGGGSLLDVGIYCLAPLLAVAGQEPADVAAQAVIAESGVDASFSGWLGFPGGFSAAFQTSFETGERQTLEIAGTEGAIVVDHAFTPSTVDMHVWLTKRDGSDQIIVSEGNDPYVAMVEHFAAVVRGAEPARRPPEDSIALLRLLDRLRAAAVPSH